MSLVMILFSFLSYTRRSTRIMIRASVKGIFSFISFINFLHPDM